MIEITVKKINTRTIDKFMLQKRLTKTGFCKLCGISRYSLDNIYKEDNVKLVVLFKILENTKLSLRDLLNF